MANTPFAGLSQEDTDTYYAWENSLRSDAGQFGKLLDKIAALNTMYNGQISAILAKFNTNIAAPNTSGLAGAQSLNVGAEAVTIMSHFQAALTTFNDSGHLQMWTKAAGINNMAP